MTPNELFSILITVAILGGAWRYLRRISRWLLVGGILLLVRPATEVCASRGVSVCEAAEDLFQEVSLAAKDLVDGVSDSAGEAAEILSDIPENVLDRFPSGALQGRKFPAVAKDASSSDAREPLNE